MTRWVMRPDTSVSADHEHDREDDRDLLLGLAASTSTGPSVHFITSVAFHGPLQVDGQLDRLLLRRPAGGCLVNPSGWRANGAKRVISGRSPRGATMRLEGVYASR